MDWNIPATMGTVDWKFTNKKEKIRKRAGFIFIYP